MAPTYTCLNYGSCPNAGLPQSAPGAGSTCPSCGGMMLAQGKSKRPRGPGMVVKRALVGVLGLVALMVVWKALPTGFSFTQRHHDIIGRWRVEKATIMDATLPIGPALEFSANSATVLQSKVPVTAYDRDGDRVHVVVPGGAGMEVNFTFRFDGPDRIVYEGPLGISLRYRRVKEVQ